MNELWEQLAHGMCGEWNVFGADIFNEPYAGRWGGGGTRDWAFGAAEMGNHVLRGCPRLLVFVQGTNENHAQWGGSLSGLRSRMNAPGPIRLFNLSKLVMSPHAYGPSLYKPAGTQQFMPREFQTSSFSSLERNWENVFGFVTSTGHRPPLVLSEIGGDMTCCSMPGVLSQPGADALWQEAIFKYLKQKSAGLFYFCLNPYSDDTGGLLQKDLETPSTTSLLLSSLPTRVVYLQPPTAQNAAAT